MRLWTRLRCVVILAALPGLLASTTAAESPTLSQEVEGLLRRGQSHGVRGASGTLYPPTTRWAASR